MILQSKKMRHASGLTMIEIVPRTYGKRQKRPKVAVLLPLTSSWELMWKWKTGNPIKVLVCRQAQLWG